MEGHLYITEKDNLSISGNEDGFLGGRWHAEKIILFDYIDHKMSIFDTMSDVNVEQFDVIDLGFQKKDGKYTRAFPSIEIKILGVTLPMLFDTGATAKLSENAKTVLNSKDTLIGTSYVVASTFDKWKRNNPTWLVIDGADELANESMIRVPQIQIGTRTVGPVWFTRRKDYNFHTFMSSMMDQKVEGAIGGSLLKYLRVIIDYPNEIAYISN